MYQIFEKDIEEHMQNWPLTGAATDTSQLAKLRYNDVIIT